MNKAQTLQNRFRGIELSRGTRKLSEEIEKCYSRMKEVEGMKIADGVSIDSLDREAETIAKARIESEEIALKIPILEERFVPLFIEDVKAYINREEKRHREAAVAAGKARQLAEKLENEAKAAKRKAEEKQGIAGSMSMAVSALKLELQRIESGAPLSARTAMVERALINTRRPATAGAAR
ncbi:MAG: hypothetical protein KBA61_02910 [Spirochaetes bacterium]|nr:hypothetical protein [Spirochaetota bacterium]